MAEADGNANANRDWKRSWEKFTVEQLGSNKIALKSVHGKYFAAENECAGYAVNANRDHCRSWETFTVEVQDDFCGVALKTAHGRYVVAELDGTLRADRTWKRTWETFWPECIN